MRLLLDESLPRRLKGDFVGHDVVTVPEQGWAGRENGELLLLASKQFDVFVTADQNLPHQHNLADFDLRVVVLAGRSNRLGDLRPLVTKALGEIAALDPGKVVVVAG